MESLIVLTALTLFIFISSIVVLIKYGFWAFRDVALFFFICFFIFIIMQIILFEGSVFLINAFFQLTDSYNSIEYGIIFEYFFVILIIALIGASFRVLEQRT